MYETPFRPKILESSLIHLVIQKKRLHKIEQKTQLWNILFNIWVLHFTLFNLLLFITRWIRKDSNTFERVQYGMYIWMELRDWIHRGAIRATSYYGWRLRGHGFSPIRLLETKSLPSQSFTLEAKVHQLWFSKVPTWPKQRTLEESLGRGKIEIQTMILWT